MALGFGGQNFLAGRQDQRHKEQLAVENRRAQQEQALKEAEGLKTRFQDIVKQGTEMISTIRQSENVSLNDPQAQQMLAPVIEGAAQLSQKLIQVGVMSPQEAQTAFAQMRVAAQSPTQKQQLEQKAKEKEVLSAAQAKGKASVEPRTVSRVISGDSEANQRFGLGIPPGESARVEFREFPDGRTEANVEGRFGTGQTINISTGGGKFQEEAGKLQAGRIDEVINRGRLATGMQQTLFQMADLLKGGVSTGTLQPALTGLQGFAADLGLDMSSIAESAGINLGDLSSKEEFDRLAKSVIIEGFEKFKGNLNQKEVELAIDAFANLGRSEQGNVEAVASMLAAQSIARRRAEQAAGVQSRAEATALERELLSESPEQFNTLKKEFKEQIQSTNEEQASGVPGGISQEVWDAMTPEEKALFE